MNEVKSCEKCVYFIGMLARGEESKRWKWTHCRYGVQNIPEDNANTCEEYAPTIQIAIEKNTKHFKKRMGWDKCPYCGGKI